MSKHKIAAGSGLIEVLISVLILGIGLLGVVAMQATALRNSQGAYERSVAIVQSYSMLDTMRANRNEALIGRYDLNWTCNPPNAGNLIASDLNEWITRLQSQVSSSACGRITCNTAVCTVEVRWNQSRSTGGEDEESILTSTRL